MAVLDDDQLAEYAPTLQLLVLNAIEAQFEVAKALETMQETATEHVVQVEFLQHFSRLNARAEVYVTVKRLIEEGGGNSELILKDILEHSRHSYHILGGMSDLYSGWMQSTWSEVDSLIRNALYPVDLPIKYV